MLDVYLLLLEFRRHTRKIPTASLARRADDQFVFDQDIIHLQQSGNLDFLSSSTSLGTGRISGSSSLDPRSGTVQPPHNFGDAAAQFLDIIPILSLSRETAGSGG